MLLLFGSVKLVAESTCTSMDARDVSNARLHEKGKGSNGILFFGVCDSLPALGVVVMRHRLPRQVQILNDRVGVEATPP